MRRTFLLLSLAVLGAAPAHAWTSPLMEALNRDARKLLPRSLRRLLAERETQIVEEIRRFPPAVSQALGADASACRITPETTAALQAETAAVVELLKKQRLTEGLVRLGGLLRIPADLSDPVLAVGTEGYLAKIHVVMGDPAALRLEGKGLPGYWQSLLDRSRDQSELIRTEMIQDGRVVSHKNLDYRSPVYAVASLSYSRAVNGIAATWLAVWREAHGDTTRTPKPREVEPRDGPPALVLLTPPSEEP